MLGQRLAPVAHHPMAALMGAQRLRETLGGLRTDVEAEVNALPDYGAFLEGYCGA